MSNSAESIKFIEETIGVIRAFVISECTGNICFGVAVKKDEFNFVFSELSRLSGKYCPVGTECKIDFFTPVGNEHNFF